MCIRSKCKIPKFNLGIPQTINVTEESVISSPNTPLFLTSNFKAAQILKGSLFLGSENDAKEAPLEIKRFLCVADNCENVKRNNSISMFLPIKDHSDQEITQFFPDAFRFINEAIEKNEPILVYCQKGYSRSVSFVIGYIMTFCKDILTNIVVDDSTSSIIYQKAFQYVKTKRPKASPNLGFCIALNTLGESFD